MARGKVSTGEHLTFTAPSGGVVAGTPKIIGSMWVIPLTTKAETLKFAADYQGVWVLPKETGGGKAWTEGAKVYWDAGNNRVTIDAIDGALLGVAYTAAADGATTGEVLLLNPLAEIGEGPQAAIPDWTLTLVAGTANDASAAIPLPTDTPASADALRDDIATNIIPAIRDNFADVGTKLNSVLAVLRTHGLIAP